MLGSFQKNENTTEWEFLAVLESCAIGIFFLDSMKAEDLTLPKFLASSSVCSSLFIYGWHIPGSSNSTAFPSLLCSYFILLFSGWLRPLPHLFCLCHLLVVHNWSVFSWFSVTYSWYTIEEFSHDFLSFTLSTHLEYFLVVCCICAVAVILLKTTKHFVFFLLKHIQALIIVN